MNRFIKSPFNYVGGKFRLLPQIFPCFPDNISIFVDLFCGGGNVGINAPAKYVKYNDKNIHIGGILRFFRKNGFQKTIEGISSIIRQYDLSSSIMDEKNARIKKKSGKLSDYNRISFEKLRKDYNDMKNNNDPSSFSDLMLYVLIIYSFNFQIRFNLKGMYNSPVGKHDFNPSIKHNLECFINRICSQNCSISDHDFRNYDILRLGEEDFVYLDPPYLITLASYNEKGGWKERDEYDLLDFIDNLNSRKIRFALSNVLSCKGKENNILKVWLAGNNYVVKHLEHSYANSNYHKNDKKSPSDEILVMNYIKE